MLRNGQDDTEGRGDDSPSAQKAATCSRLMGPVYSHTTSPSPPAGSNQMGAPSLWPPSTFLTPEGTLSHAPSTTQNSWGPATVLRSQARQRPSQFLLFLCGCVASTPQRLHSQLRPSDRDRLKTKNQLKAINGGEQDMVVVVMMAQSIHYFITAPLLLREWVQFDYERI